MTRDPEDAPRGPAPRPSLSDLLRLVLAPDGDVDVRHSDDWCGANRAPRMPGLPPRPRGPLT